MTTTLPCRAWTALAAILLLPAPLFGVQAPAQGAPPSPADVLGYPLGQRFTDHAGAVRYMEALAGASDRVELRPYGETTEGRRLLQVVIGRPDHLAGLDRILDANRELSDPSTPEARAREIAATNPAVVYFSYGVHGNESSSTEAALYAAWDLARDAEEVSGVLDSVIVVLDPVTNPDGRDRYVNWYRQARGLVPNPRPESREHWEPWPGGRFNHYLFDLNRDWAWATQAETRQRLATWSTWTPQVHVDFHEMGWTSNYFFFPATPPINPLYPAHILEWGQRFGAANAAAFDRRGWAYFTAESFDLFYPGYGDSWPSLVGAVGMTYEQAGHSRAGLAVDRPDGVRLTLRDRAEHHRVSGAATLRAAAIQKSLLLQDFARFHRDVDAGLADILLVPDADAGRLRELVGLLQDQGIVVEEAGRAFRTAATAHSGFAARRDFPPGTMRVRARQTRGRLAVTLLQPETVLDATYSYDVSAWSLPFAFAVEAHSAARVPEAAWSVVARVERLMGNAPAPAWDGTGVSLPEPEFGGDRRLLATGARDGGDPGAADDLAAPAASAYGYLVPPGFSSWPGVVRFLGEGGRAIVLDRAFTMEGRRWARGTILLPRYANRDLDGRVSRSELGQRAMPVRSGLTSDGNDLGTGRAYAIALPRIGLLAGPGVSPTSFGAHWFFLERTLGIPFDQLPIDALEPIDPGRYDVLVVPEIGTEARRALERDTARLASWLERGGTLVAVGAGAAALAEPLAAIERREPPEPEDEDVRIERALRTRDARELERWEQSVPGTILPVRLDASHPLAFGTGVEDGERERPLFVLHTGPVAFRPDEDFETVGYFPADVEAVSGVISPQNLERLSRGSWLAVKRRGAGKVILFADDPVFRHFWYSTFQPYANALLVGPSM